MDKDSAFMSSLMNYLFNKLDIKIKTVAPFNYQSLQAEYRNKSLSMILMKCLTNLGQMWPKYLSLATFAYNTCYLVITYSIMWLQCYTHGPRVSLLSNITILWPMKPEWKLCKSSVIIGLSYQWFYNALSML